MRTKLKQVQKAKTIKKWIKSKITNITIRVQEEENIQVNVKVVNRDNKALKDLIKNEREKVNKI